MVNMIGGLRVRSIVIIIVVGYVESIFFFIDFTAKNVERHRENVVKR